MFRLSRFFRSAASARATPIAAVNERRSELRALDDASLRAAGNQATTLTEVVAVTAVVAERTLGLEMFDVQIEGAFALAEGKIAEMQTGEGKTLAAVPAIVWYAREGEGVHVMTVNDYLARRDAEWMGPIYAFLRISVGCIRPGMSRAERKSSWACDVTYATANETGFDYLRDQLALQPGDQVHRPFATAVIDEADSILIDEARIPLVIAGGEGEEASHAYPADEVVRGLVADEHYTLDEHASNVALTEDGVALVERMLGCGNLFEDRNLAAHAALQYALHAHTLLKRDVDYVVKDGAIESVDEFKGRIVEDRRWPAGLHTAIEAKEGVALKKQGRVLGSITLQNLIALYPQVCGMTGTAKTQEDELREIYQLDVQVIPTNRPVIRIDEPDAVFETKQQKEEAVVDEIRRLHAVGRPALVGTSSIEASERLSGKLDDIPHEVLNAKNHEREAEIIARAGQPGAVTISTNMAGRGVDIKLGPGVAELGGLYVLGTNKHESRRIDNQLRGRAGRQGDPGGSRFFISREDDLFAKHARKDPSLGDDLEHLQRLVEGRNLGARRFLHQYEGILEGQRRQIHGLRQEILTGAKPCASETERLVTLTTIDDLWSEHLAAVQELREGIHWVSAGGRNPLHEYITGVHEAFQELLARIDDEVEQRMADPAPAPELGRRGATWTYLTTDNPFGTGRERLFRGLARKAKNRTFWG